jgi:hypothetical protein
MQVLREAGDVGTEGQNWRTLGGLMNRHIDVKELAALLSLDPESQSVRDVLYRGGLGIGCLKRVHLGRLTRWVRVQVLRHLENLEDSEDGRCDGSCRNAIAEEQQPRMYAVK